jgi:hypothetical protein
MQLIAQPTDTVQAIAGIGNPVFALIGKANKERGA